MTAKKEVLRFEADADERVRGLGLWRMPMRSVVSALYVLADEFVTGGRISPNGPKRQPQGIRLIGNLSYLAEMIAGCPPDQIGAHIDDALSVVTPDVAPDLLSAIAYATFCEFMPSVHRGHFAVEATERGFRLTHLSEAVRDTEARDVVLTELVLPFENEPPRLEAWMFDTLYEAWPRLRGDLFALALVNSRARYRRSLQEAPLLPRTAYTSAFGFSREDFEGFQVGLMALADFCVGMADAAARQARATEGKRRRRHERESREWVAPLLSENFVFGIAAGLGGVDVAAFDKIAPYFTVDARAGGFPQAGEGFWPPFLRFNRAVLFSPHALRSMLSERNLLYALNRLDRDRFDRLVSEHLEPALLDDAEASFSAVPSFRVARNVEWRVGDKEGEVDLLVVQPNTGSALHVQAKAAIPPQGARMTRRIEDRTFEAIEQIEAFDRLDADSRDRICARAIGSEPIAMEWHSAILSRSCFGTDRAWSRLGVATPLNPVLLRGALKRLESTPLASLRDLPSIAMELLNEIVAATASNWVAEEIPVFNKMVEIPSLRIDERRLAALRERMFGNGRM